MLNGIKKSAAVVATTVLTAPAMAAEGSSSSTGVDGIFAAVDLSSVSNFVVTTGVTVIGIALAMKGITLAKRALNKA
ncbi:phage coat protein [Photobacterium damselae]